MEAFIFSSRARLRIEIGARTLRMGDGSDRAAEAKS
jgi:hypothetical protein